MASGDGITDDTLASAAPPRRDEPRAGDRVGAYTIEQVLGAGGMGIVYAAHDPDLDRRIALKILRSAARGDHDSPARARLLREARAMARVTHPNVITVHQVGTDAQHRDYIAMERIDGRTVADWLTVRRSVDDVLRVMIAAGRGLAAAHRAGLIHRDFKPHNVLLGRDGRVVVTDFGLARAYEGDATVASRRTARAVAAIALDETADAGTTPPARADASSLSSTLTQTGAMLGTPAYMAPEQFAGGSTGPETDQFAFCVAMWEGLTGARPFRGGSVDELRRAVDGAIPVGGEKLPRRLRAALERGLRRDPSARWPSMDALLAAVAAPRRRIRRLELAVVAAVAAIAAIVIGYLMLGRRPAAAAPAAAACAPGIVQQWPVWSPGRAAALAPRFAAEPAGWAGARGGLDRFAAGWRATWDRACAAPEDPHFHARVACLDDALDEAAAVIDLLGTVPPEALRSTETMSMLRPPEACLETRRIGYPPVPDDPALRRAVIAIHRDLAAARTRVRYGREDDARALAAQATAAARALATRYPAVLADALEGQGAVLHVAGDREAAEAAYDEAARVAERAGHDPARALALLGTLELLAARTSDAAKVRDAADDALAAIARAGDDPVLRASVDIELASLAASQGAIDDAIERIAKARATMAQAGDDRRAGVAAQVEASYRILRDAPGDGARALALLEEAYRRAATVYGAAHPRTRQARRALAQTRWSYGDLAGAHALFADLDDPPTAPEPEPAPPVSVRGRVVDGAGRPVAGAHVHAGGHLYGDARAIAVPALVVERRSYASAVSDADGRFRLAIAGPAIVVAEAEELRSPPVRAGGGELVLRVGRTGTISASSPLTPMTATGDDPTLALAARARAGSAAITTLGDAVFTLLTPVLGGRWSIPAVPPGRYPVLVTASTALGDFHQRIRMVDVRADATTTIALPLDLDGVVVDVVVRGDRATTIPSAQVSVLRGRHPARDTKGLLDAVVAAGGSELGFAVPVDEHTSTAPGREVYAPGDIHTRIAAVAPGTVTICVMPFGGDAADPTVLAQVTRATNLDVTCRTLEVAATPSVQAFVLEVAPQRRLIERKSSH